MIRDRLYRIKPMEIRIWRVKPQVDEIGIRAKPL